MIRHVFDQRFTVSGHRGYAARYPENTLFSFQAAIELGVDMLELDLHLSADGVIMVLHDNTLDRTTNGRGLLRDKTCAQRRGLPPGRGAAGGHVPANVPRGDGGADVKGEGMSVRYPL